MEARLSSSLIMIILFTLPLSLKAQEYREAPHACFKLEEDRVIPLGESEFKFRKEWSGKQVFVRIPAIPVSCSVIINGFPLRVEPGRTASSEYNITPFLKEKDNCIDLPPAACSLLIRDAVHIRDIMITQHPGLAGDETLMRIHLFLKSYLREAYRERSIFLDLRDPDGQRVMQKSRNLSTALSFGQETELTFGLNLEKPVPWLPGLPNLYEVSISLEVEGDQKPELISAQFGFTSFWHNDSLLLQNGDTMLLRYPSSDQATILPEMTEEEILEMMVESGINAICPDVPLPCHLEALFQRCGILVVSSTD